jgi:UDP-N-acetylglucosamine diphosphorylase/glucosamine-1-phosphate N-acetyltransferase
MRLCFFEDSGVYLLDPLSLTRPAFDLRCGALTLAERHLRAASKAEVGAIVRPSLAPLCRVRYPDWSVNDAHWLRRDRTILINARWLPSDEPIDDWHSPRVGVVGDQVAYVVPPADLSELTFETLADSLESWKQTLPQCAAGGDMIDYAWDLVEHNPATLRRDWRWFRDANPNGGKSAHVAVVGPEDKLVVHPQASLDPYVVADTRQGPVLIDRGATIHAFSRLEGPCYVGPESHVLGAKLRGGTIGPFCRVGGEFEASILQGYTNKYHDGFLGHSYLGEWVNLAAGTQVSDLRNDYGEIRVWVAGERVPTGLNKIGCFLGDHTKSGLGTLLNSGTVAGAFCQLLPTGTLLPSLVPSFCAVNHGQIQERQDLRQMITTAAAVMRRRGRELTTVDTDFWFGLFDQTAAARRQVIREAEQRRLRRSV